MLLDANGTLINKEEYTPFGETSFGSYGRKRYRYNGKEKDEESGLYNYGMRYYAPWMCRFISVDPLAPKYAHLSPYQYASNDPVNQRDIDGLEGEKAEESAGQASDNQNISSEETINQAEVNGDNIKFTETHKYAPYTNKDGTATQVTETLQMSISAEGKVNTLQSRTTTTTDKEGNIVSLNTDSYSSVGNYDQLSNEGKDWLSHKMSELGDQLDAPPSNQQDSATSSNIVYENKEQGVMIFDHAMISESVNILSKVAGILEHVSGHIGVLPTAAAKAEQVLTGVVQYEMGSGKTFGIDNKQHYKEIAKKNNLVQSSKTLPKSGKVGQFLAKAAGALRWLNIGFGVVGVGASYYLYAHAENPTEKFWSGMDIFVGVVSTGLAIAALFISSPVIAAAATIAGVISLIYFVGRLIF